jgi:acyl transferase domain-containing protein
VARTPAIAFSRADARPLLGENGYGIAVIGMSCRVPGASTLEEFWQQILTGACCISDLPAKAGEVGARGVLADVDRFDADLFRFTHSDAAALDPQHRVFLELCWHALEDAGIDPFRTDEHIAVYASSAPPAQGPTDGTTLSDEYHRTLSTLPDFVATRVSHRLDLKGESVVVQTACSSSLVAVHMACQSLLTGQCDAALAGGISIAGDQSRGYAYEEAMVFSADGRCRPFDEEAGGTVPGSGGGVVVLKRLADAVRDGHAVHAVVRGSALNNDGATKASYMAPSVTGQDAVVARALAIAGVDPSTVGLIEAHGTATPLGDEIEIEALKRAFQGRSDQATALGSLKGACGHLDRGAGVAGLIKAALCLSHHTLPPSSGSSIPRSSLELERSPFHLVQTAKRWEQDGTPRRAGVSAFGVGGTNAHAILEEPPPATAPAIPSGAPVLVTISARSETSLAAMTTGLADWLEEELPEDLESVAATRNLNRVQLDQRCFAVGRTATELASALREAAPRSAARPRLVFMFPGHGGAAPHASSVLYRSYEPYRAAVDTCIEVLGARGDVDLRPYLVDGALEVEGRLSQPALFVAEYALAQLLLAWGIRPHALLGHSLGELVAATVAGIFKLEDALRLVVVRGQILDEHAAGAMLSVALSREEAREAIAGRELDLAAVNAERSCVLSGKAADVALLEASLEEAGVKTRRLQLGWAGHSRLLEPGLARMKRALQPLALAKPTIPIVSTRAGDVALDGELSVAEYWVRHLRDTVDFAAAVRTASSEDTLFVEVGFGHGLSWLVQQDGGADETRTAVPLVDPDDAEASVLDAIGSLWASGVELDWEEVHGNRQTQRVRLPLYVFDHALRWPSSTHADPLEEKTANGPPASSDPPAAEPLRPAELEQRLCALWRDLLGTDVSPSDNFFDLGGDSVKAIRMVALAGGQGIAIALRPFLRDPTIAGVAEQAKAASPLPVSVRESR